MKKEIAFVREGETLFVYCEIDHEGISIRAKEGQATRAVKDYVTKLYHEMGESITRIERHGYAGYSQRGSGKKFYAFRYQLLRA